MKKILGTAVLLAVVSMWGCGGGSTEAPTVDLTGDWEVTETIKTADGICSGNVGEVSVWTASVVQNGNDVTVTITSGANVGAVFTGTVSGNKIDWSGSYPTSGGTTTVTGSDVTATNTSLSGTASWDWSDSTDSCSGTTSVNGAKI
jgi:hypothetical protein